MDSDPELVDLTSEHHTPTTSANRRTKTMPSFREQLLNSQRRKQRHAAIAIDSDEEAELDRLRSADGAALKPPSKLRRVENSDLGRIRSAQPQAVKDNDSLFMPMDSTSTNDARHGSRELGSPSAAVFRYPRTTPTAERWRRGALTDPPTPADRKFEQPHTPLNSSKRARVREAPESDTLEETPRKRRKAAAADLFPARKSRLTGPPSPTPRIASPPPSPPPSAGTDTTLQDLPQALTTITDLLTGPESPLNLIRDLAHKVNSMQTRIDSLEADNASLRKHMDDTLSTSAEQTRKALREMQEKCDEAIYAADQLSPSIPVPGGPYGGSPFRQPERRPNILERSFGTERRSIPQPGSRDYFESR